MLHASVGHTLARPWSPRIGLEYDYGSGDEDPTDSRWNRFDGLFGHRRQELAPTGIYGALGRENINTLGLRISFMPRTGVDTFVVYRRLRLASPTDAFASTGVRDVSGHSGRDAGQQVDIRFRTWIVPELVCLDLGATHLMFGRFFDLAPNASHSGDTTYFYADVAYLVSSKRSAARALTKR